MTLYSIKDLEYFSGIKAHTIRIWEKRYHLLEPSRTETNIRYYSDHDVRKILNIALLIKNGYKISNIAAFDEARLQAEVLRFNKNLSDPEKNIDQLLFYTVNLDTIGFEQLLDKIILEMGFSKTIQQVVFPFFERIGILWQAGSIFVAHEHFVCRT
jgi:DNA-binding transcriptional MerR regulator